MDVFFYGLFMDETLLASKGVYPKATAMGYVDGVALHIGKRATLVHCESGRAYGIVMNVEPSQLERLYSEPSVADYVPESVLVSRPDGNRREAITYIITVASGTAADAVYASDLVKLCRRLGFPEAYIDEIRPNA